MQSPTDPYSEQSETIEAVLAHACRRHRLTHDAGDEFSSWARLRLIENDYAIIRKFRGQSSFRTFLHAVVLRKFLDWRNQQWGRWRPTAVARKLGPVAIELERMVLRDRRHYDEAVQALLSTGVVSARDECDLAWAQLRRLPPREVTDADGLQDLPAPINQYAHVDFSDLPQRVLRLGTALTGALQSLGDQDQIILRMDVLDDFTAKQIGAALALEAKPLYRRIEQIKARLGVFLTSAGLTAEEITDLFSNPAVELGDILDRELRKPKAGPSIDENAEGNQ